MRKTSTILGIVLRLYNDELCAAYESYGTTAVVSHLRWTLRSLDIEADPPRTGPLTKAEVKHVIETLFVSMWGDDPEQWPAFGTPDVPGYEHVWYAERVNLESWWLCTSTNYCAAKNEMSFSIYARMHNQTTRAWLDDLITKYKALGQ